MNCIEDSTGFFSSCNVTVHNIYLHTIPCLECTAQKVHVSVICLVTRVTEIYIPPYVLIGDFESHLSSSYLPVKFNPT